MANDELKQNKSERRDGNLNFLTFADVVYSLLEKTWGKDWGKFAMERPLSFDAKDVRLPTITYQLRRIVPGDIGNGKRERVPRKRGSFEVMIDGEKRTVIDHGQTMDAEVVFTVYGESNLETIETTQAFIDLMHHGKGLLLKKGLSSIWFKEDVEIEVQNRESVYGREVVYDVKFERIFRSVPENIEKMQVEADTFHDKAMRGGTLPSQEKKNKEDYK